METNFNHARRKAICLQLVNIVVVLIKQLPHFWKTAQVLSLDPAVLLILQPNVYNIVHVQTDCIVYHYIDGLFTKYFSLLLIMFKEYRNKAFVVEISAPVFLVPGIVLVLQAHQPYFQRQS